MPSFHRSKIGLPLLVAVLLGLLALLAWLQYRWLGQVSEAERERRQSALHIAAQRFGEDFDRELARAFVSFQLDEETIRQQTWDEYARRYELWWSQAPHAQMVKAIYLVRSESPTEVLRYEPQSRRFVAETAAPALANLQRDLARQTQEVITQMRQPGAAAFFSPNFFPLVEGFPAIVCPVLPVLSLDTKPVTQKIERFPAPERFTVVLLNQEYLGQEMIPALARRYFASAENQREWDYHLQIINPDAPQTPIFASDMGANANPLAADAAFPLFRLRLELVDNFSLGARFFTAAIPLPQRAATLVENTRQASPPPTIATVADQATLAGDEMARWRFSLRHHSGSLENAVALVRRRNLLISFGVLLLLGTSMALVLVLTTRTRRLAAQQLEFIAGVSHELRTPVAVVCIASANLADGLVQGEQQVRSYGAMLQTEGRRLSEMVEQVLDFSGSESVNQSYQFAPVPVAEPVEHALATLRQQAGAPPLNLVCELAADLPALLADSRAIERALYNLLNNAFKYSRTPCSIRITAQRANNEQVAIVVADNGLGIDAAELKQLFQPFWRGRAARDTNAPGNGLGLCLVDRIARAHRGRVEVQSKLNEGSRFTLYLPCVPATVQRAHSTELELYEQTNFAD